MKSLIIFLILAVGFCGCTEHNTVDDRLKEAEELMFERPDSSLAILQSMAGSTDLMDNSGKALYALLLTQARARNYIPAESDSLINIAIKYYAESDDREKLAWAQLYASDVYHELGNDSLAMQSIRRAYAAAEGVENPRLHCYIHYFWGNLIEYQSPVEVGLEQLKTAKGYALAIRDTSCIVASMNEMATSYMLMKDYDLARRELQEAVAYTESPAGRRFMSTIYHKLALIDYHDEAYGDALVKINRAIDGVAFIKNYGDSLPLYSLKGAIFAKTGEPDSAKYYLEKGFSDSSPNAVGRYYLGLSYLEADRGHYREALEHYKRYASNQDSMYMMMMESKAVEWQKKYELLELEKERDRLTIANRDAWLTIVVLTVVVLLSTLFFIYKMGRSRQTLARMRAARASMINESINAVQSEMNRVLRSKQEHIERMNERLYGLDKALKKALSIKDMNNAALRRSLKQLKLMPEEMDSIKMSVNASFNGFVDMLAEMCGDLTDDDVTLCCLIRLGLTRSDISILLDVTANTLKARKARLKSKLGLDISLDDWILGTESNDDEDDEYEDEDDEYEDEEDD